MSTKMATRKTFVCHSMAMPCTVCAENARILLRKDGYMCVV